MRTKLVAAIALLALAGCNKKTGGETGAMGNDRTGTDTTIESSRVKDTTVVQKDTSIGVDTTKKTEHSEKKQ
jgi:hypothetical protein